jgi:diguanylate cyclase (GGDEF)-like protein
MPHPRRAVPSHGSRVAEGRATDGNGPSARLRRAPRFQLELLLKDFAHFIDSDVALLYQGKGPGQTPTLSCWWGLGRPPQQIARPVEGAVIGRALERPTQRAALGPLDPMFDSSLMVMSEPPLRFALTADVHTASRARGLLIAGFATRPRGGARMLWSAESYAAVIGLCLDDRGALAELVATGARDVLTGCLTYDATIRELDREINRSSRGGLDLSVCFIDLDDFKHINDRYGHVCGNDVLASIGQILRDGVRSCDSVGRYGGDEFVAILPQTSRTEARRLARRLGSRLANTAIAPLERPLTASIGVAQWVPGTHSENVLAAADGALLASKQRRPRAIVPRGSRSNARSNGGGAVTSDDSDMADEVA